ncbi:AraC family transcriptional regulator [uncultured Vagococcus sp.]|uniref:helix-turn-helix transcriptional regulator n=1 Tax=uncultured Vagococcus sp. TaxID=189676 RepID=UPI0028D88861|nr:AraC family transcriptional regulator [uncultured Vagococcus sp.]
MDNRTDNSQRELYSRLINKTEDFVERHLKDPIALCDLARHAHLSDFHFHRLFKTYTSETVNEFVTRFKLERAAIFLCLNPHLSVTAIAMEYGYNDSSSFSRSFKKQFGVSPLKFRKQQDLSRNNHWIIG